MYTQLNELLGLSSESVAVSQPLFVILQRVDPLSVIIRNRIGERLRRGINTVVLDSLQKKIVLGLELRHGRTVNHLEDHIPHRWARYIANEST